MLARLCLVLEKIVQLKRENSAEKVLDEYRAVARACLNLLSYEASATNKNPDPDHMLKILAEHSARADFVEGFEFITRYNHDFLLKKQQHEYMHIAIIYNSVSVIKYYSKKITWKKLYDYGDDFADLLVAIVNANQQQAIRYLNQPEFIAQFSLHISLLILPYCIGLNRTEVINFIYQHPELSKLIAYDEAFRAAFNSRNYPQVQALYRMLREKNSIDYVITFAKNYFSIQELNLPGAIVYINMILSCRISLIEEKFSLIKPAIAAFLYATVEIDDEGYLFPLKKMLMLFKSNEKLKAEFKNIFINILLKSKDARPVDGIALFHKLNYIPELSAHEWIDPKLIIRFLLIAIASNHTAAVIYYLHEKITRQDIIDNKLVHSIVMSDCSDAKYWLGVKFRDLLVMPNLTSFPESEREEIRKKYQAVISPEIDFNSNTWHDLYAKASYSPQMTDSIVGIIPRTCVSKLSYIHDAYPAIMQQTEERRRDSVLVISGLYRALIFQLWNIKNLKLDELDGFFAKCFALEKAAFKENFVTHNLYANFLLKNNQVEKALTIVTDSLAAMRKHDQPDPFVLNIYEFVCLMLQLGNILQVPRHESMFVSASEMFSVAVTASKISLECLLKNSLACMLLLMHSDVNVNLLAAQLQRIKGILARLDLIPRSDIDEDDNVLRTVLIPTADQFLQCISRFFDGCKNKAPAAEEKQYDELKKSFKQKVRTLFKSDNKPNLIAYRPKQTPYDKALAALREIPITNITKEVLIYPRLLQEKPAEYAFERQSQALDLSQDSTKRAYVAAIVKLCGIFAKYSLIFENNAGYTYWQAHQELYASGPISALSLEQLRATKKYLEDQVLIEHAKMKNSRQPLCDVIDETVVRLQALPDEAIKEIKANAGSNSGNAAITKFAKLTEHLRDSQLQLNRVDTALLLLSNAVLKVNVGLSLFAVKDSPAQTELAVIVANTI